MLDIIIHDGIVITLEGEGLGIIEKRAVVIKDNNLKRGC